MPGDAGAPRVRFEETQYLRSFLIWGIVALVTLAALGTAIWAATSDDESTLDTILLFGTALFVPALVAFIRLRTVVTEHEVIVTFRALLRRRFPLAEIASAEARAYRPMREFGGWGIRLGRGGLRAYTMDGNQGVELRLLNGRRALIGSRRPNELAAAIVQARSQV